MKHVLGLCFDSISQLFYLFIAPYPISSSPTSQVRDWGKGMATASVEKRTDIDKGHIGPIPDVDVGQTWVFRADCAASGVHRPPVSGMHSKGTVCYSIVASHGYEDDADQGDEIWYTGELEFLFPSLARVIWFPEISNHSSQVFDVSQGL